MGRILLLVELKGGNDGLNTVIPYADAKYHELRPGIAVARDRTIHLDERVGLH
ncbi:MAG: Twin-arginine translocation pathway signal sequence domain-containing protein, partial [Alphaproteobacteria bacterium]|nr:Twin-arginine translocation pathway signal sequence domain-containing protein [Alphaproteobacteria bacterium]